AEIAGQRIVVAGGGAGEAVEQAVHAFEYGARPEETRAGEPRRPQPGLRRPARMQALGPGALREIFDDAAGHGTDDAERVDKLARTKLERGADASGRRPGAERGGGRKAGFAPGLGRTRAGPADHLDADRDAEQRRGSIGVVALAGCEHRRHDDGAGMHRTAFEGIVEILAMRGG